MPATGLEARRGQATAAVRVLRGWYASQQIPALSQAYNVVISARRRWLREEDLNRRPSGYEPDSAAGLLHPAVDLYHIPEGRKRVLRRGGFRLLGLGVPPPKSAVGQGTYERASGSSNPRSPPLLNGGLIGTWHPPGPMRDIQQPPRS